MAQDRAATVIVAWLAVTALGCTGSSDDAATKTSTADAALADQPPAQETAATDTVAPPDLAPGDAPVRTPDTAPDTPTPEDTPDDSEEPPPLEAPQAAVLGAPVTATFEVLLPPPVLFAAALADDAVLARGATETVIVTSAKDPKTVLADTGVPRALTTAGDDAWLVAADKGLFALQGDKLKPSPMSPLLPAPPASLARTSSQGASWLWLLAGDTSNGDTPNGATLWLHDGKKLHSVSLGGLDLHGARLSAGPDVLVAADGWPGSFPKPASFKPALWLQNGGSLHAVLSDGVTATAWLDRDDLPSTQIQADADGALWLVVNGDLRRRDPDESWLWWHLPSDVTAVAGREGRDDVAVTAKNGLYLHRSGVFYAVVATQGLHALGLDDAGRILTVGAKGLVRVTPATAKPPPVTWTKDVSPINEQRCQFCHKPGGVAGAVPLVTAAQWQERIDMILKLVGQNYMPKGPPPLSKKQKLAIQKWMEGGFLVQ